MCNHPLDKRYGYTLSGSSIFCVVCMACNELLKGYREYEEQSRGQILSMKPAQKGIANKRAKVDYNQDSADAKATELGHSLQWDKAGIAFSMVGDCENCGAHVYVGVEHRVGYALTMSCKEVERARERAEVGDYDGT